MAAPELKELLLLDRWPGRIEDDTYAQRVPNDMLLTRYGDVALGQRDLQVSVDLIGSRTFDTGNVILKRTWGRWRRQS